MIRNPTARHAANSRYLRSVSNLHDLYFSFALDDGIRSSVDLNSTPVIQIIQLQSWRGLWFNPPFLQRLLVTARSVQRDPVTRKEKLR
ncbi:hypothetical protein L2E82_27340 [Cichorium intybus]|uniref:Uncharacterized protein n=1 Tax=Cichorium intybus TaxID=13427 RepID=A0ACB9CSU6_CICIN|nr:hypothetical protein L2E82_27340 [Cichorium intybus]